MLKDAHDAHQANFFRKRGKHLSWPRDLLQQRPSTTPNYMGPFITVAILFFIFGFITNLNMALVPHLRSIFDLPYAWAMLAESAFFLAYFVFSSPTSKLIETIGYKRTMVVSLFIQVVGCLLFVPAAKLVSFPLFLTAVFVVGAGVTALQTAANPYVAILGPEHSAPVRLTLAQALNSLGGTIAPLVAGAYILTDPAGRHQGRRRQHGARTVYCHRRRAADPGVRRLRSCTCRTSRRPRSSVPAGKAIRS